MTSTQVTDSRPPRRRRSFGEAVDGVDAATRVDARRVLAMVAQTDYAAGSLVTGGELL